LNSKQSQVDSLQQLCDENKNKIKTLEEAVVRVLKEKKEMSKLITQTQEELVATKQQLTSYQEKVKKLSDEKNSKQFLKRL